jgi:hypothetical protein
MTRRVLIAFAVSVTSILAAVAQASGAAVPRAQLTGLACHSPSVPAQRAVSIETVMRPVAGTRSLSVRLTLLQRRAGQAPQTVAPSGDLGVWLTPAEKTLGRRPGDVWKLAKTVYDVDAPARYRFSVQFRWLGAGDRVLRLVTLRSGACAVTDPRPDLLVRSVAVRPAGHHGTRDRYVALIANRGASASGPFAVQFTATTGAAARTRPLASLAAGAHVRVAFTGPVCDSAAPPVVVADPDDRVDDANRANNAATVACPDT